MLDIENSTEFCEKFEKEMSDFVKCSFLFSLF